MRLCARRRRNCAGARRPARRQCAGRRRRAGRAERVAALSRPPDARHGARRSDGARSRGDRRPARSGRPRARVVRAAQRPEDRARGDAARRRRRHLREPAERHRRRRRPLPQGRQCRHSARRLGESSLDRGDPRLPRRRSSRRGTAGGGDLARRRRAIAPLSASCSPGSTAPSTSSCRAAARASSRACSMRRACRCSPISKASCTSSSIAHADLDMAKKHRAQRQTAAHRHLRRGRDAAGRSRLRGHASRAAGENAARRRLRSARRRRRRRTVDARVKPATEEDWRAEYLDAIISVARRRRARRGDRPYRDLRLASHRLHHHAE